MSTYAIGDIQGCYTELQHLLELIHFNPQQDVLWCTGDLVNRGPNSLEVLRFFKELKERAIVVLGNHDMHLLVIAYSHIEYLKPRDTLIPILEAPDREELLAWLRCRPFLHHDADLGFTLIHAGLPPQWDLLQARQRAAEIEETLRGSQYQKYLTHLYGNEPKKWSNKLTGWNRLRFITNCFTRLRYCNAKGHLDMKKKGIPELQKKQNSEAQPWFLLSNRASRDMKIIFGHWSTLGYYANNGVYALDTGCLWGGALTALRLEDKQVFTLPCAGERLPGDE
ncbi:symmetrical bis(5'-nucleosyl)-tetraphosphatase [Candidatus Parabeggiatoa sp. HSG14]|uniref:symmetrical bis(5'-nucleosyl)-tetraphosphatase n=1 Tax=Candidatus Parabeggiatoa sp. HSG14 TaxID=3055593 RepID=UPI0025A928AC|nr:symmetrical bis(5'-nucleosyl)-tetraphosphatase [Thiotrichales bacterium HSG14]